LNPKKPKIKPTKQTTNPKTKQPTKNNPHVAKPFNNNNQKQPKPNPKHKTQQNPQPTKNQKHKNTQQQQINK
jgi:hypothetical protein